MPVLSSRTKPDVAGLKRLAVHSLRDVLGELGHAINGMSLGTIFDLGSWIGGRLFGARLASCGAAASAPLSPWSCADTDRFPRLRAFIV